MSRKLTDKMGFGKYKNYTVKEVIEDDPTYIEWALDEVNWFLLDDEAMETYEKTIDKHYKQTANDFNGGYEPYFDFGDN